MQASFIIGFHTQRMDNLLQTIRFLEKYHPEVTTDSQLVLVCQDKCDDIPNNFADYVHINLNLQYMHLPYVTNIGVDAASAEKIVILESDRILPPGYYTDIFKELVPGKIITTDGMVKLEEPVEDSVIDDIVLHSNDIMCKHHPESRTTSNQLGMRNAFSGNTSITKTDYLRVGKMDETYKGYGWADSDMTNTVTQAGIQIDYKRWYREIHLYHPQLTYAEVDQSQMFTDNGIYFCKKWGVEQPQWLKDDIKKLKARVLL